MGSLSDLCWLTVDVYDLTIAALIPEGGSKTNTWEARRRVVGTLGLISIVRKRRKPGLSYSL